MVSVELATGRDPRALDTPGLIISGMQAQKAVSNGASRHGTTGGAL